MSHDDTRHDDIVDRDVSDAYRSLASERVPEHLDRAVLAEAAKAVKPSSPILPWRRPLAWAATIALSFALILEFTQTNPDLVPPASVEPVSERYDEAAADRPAETSDLDALEEALAPGLDQDSAMPATKTEAAKRERMKELELMSAPQAAVDPQVTDEAAANGGSDAGVATEPPAELKDAARQAERRVLEQRSLPQGISSQPDPISRSSQFVEMDAEKLPCAGPTREDPEDWRQCIAALYAERRPEFSAELALYREAFPDEPVPALR